MAFKITTRLLLRELFKCDGEVNIYKMHQQYRLPINEIILAVTDLIDNELATLEDLSIKPTKALRTWVFQNRYEIFFNKEELPWKIIPQQFLTTQLLIGEIPNSETGNTPSSQ